MLQEKIGIIIEARSNSSRLKDKHFLKINRKPIIHHMINRVKLIKNVDEIIIATTKRKDDDKFEIFCSKEKIKLFRGSENNVMKRVLDAAKKFQLTIICEITGDCPFVDFELAENMIGEFLKSKHDYYSMSKSQYPHGVGVQVLSLEALSRSHKMVNNKYDLEHVTTHIKRNNQSFKIKYIKAPKKLRYPEIKLLLDEKQDFIFLKDLLIYFKDKNNYHFKTKDIIEAVRKKKIILSNNKVKRNLIK
jgi:spore coat polysaccharide biosynthesis protein SpsF